MTARSFATWMKATPVGRGRWRAVCPSHDDKSPSLSIAEGHNGRTLVRCWAGCELSDIMASVGLPMRALFAADLSPSERLKIGREESIAAAWMDAHRAVSREAFNAEREADCLLCRLGAELASMPDGAHGEIDMVGRFHLASEAFASAQMQSERHIRTCRSLTRRENPSRVHAFEMRGSRATD